MNTDGVKAFYANYAKEHEFMNVNGKVTSPEDFEVTISITMKLSELRQMRAQNAENEKASYWPLSELTGKLREICEQVDRVYTPELKQVKHCAECGNDVDLSALKIHYAQAE